MEQNIPNKLYADAASSFGMISGLFSQSGTANPTANILKQTLDGDPVLTRTGVGTYTLRITGKFKQNKVVAPGGVINATGGLYSVERTNDDTLTIKTGTGGALADGLLNNTSIIIYVRR